MSTVTKVALLMLGIVLAGMIFVRFIVPMLAVAYGGIFIDIPIPYSVVKRIGASNTILILFSTTLLGAALLILGMARLIRKLAHHR